MRNKKCSLKVNVIVTIFIIIICTLSNSYAHSGRTDSSGGHKDNKNASGLGSYHYHCGGNPPHLHNGGVCPYATKASTTSSQPSSSSTQTKKSTSVQAPTPQKLTTVDATSVKVNMAKLKLQIGSTKEVTATITPSNTTNKNITWTSSDENIVSVNESGIITANNVGIATVTAKTSNSKTASLEVTVEPINVEKIEVNTQNTEAKIGDKIEISTTIYPENATDKSLEWSVENPEIATVENGIVEAKVSGNTKIICSSKNGIQAEVEINILENEEVAEPVLENKNNSENLAVNEEKNVETIETPYANISILIILIEVLILMIINNSLKNEDNKEINNSKKIGNIISWGLTILTLLFGIAVQSIFGLVFVIMASLSIAPPICKVINKKVNEKYTVGIRIMVYIIFLFIMIMI